jgi:hypothetical protein
MEAELKALPNGNILGYKAFGKRNVTDLTQVQRICFLLLPALCGLTALLCCLTGCTSTYVKVGEFEVERISIFQKVSVVAGYDACQKPFIIYDNDGGAVTAELAGKITEGAVRGIK